MVKFEDEMRNAARAITSATEAANQCNLQELVNSLLMAQGILREQRVLTKDKKRHKVIDDMLSDIHMSKHNFLSACDCVLTAFSEFI